MARDDPEAALRYFPELTGRKQPWDSEIISRQDLREGRGADILITNYVMLELILTRAELDFPHFWRCAGHVIAQKMSSEAINLRA